MDIKLSGHFIKEIHCVFVSETTEQGEGETPSVSLSLYLLFLLLFVIASISQSGDRTG